LTALSGAALRVVAELGASETADAHGPDPCIVRRYRGWVHRRLARDLLLRFAVLSRSAML